VSGEGKLDSFDVFEEYKLFVEDTARFTERRQTVNNTYVAVNSIILSAIALLVKDVSANGCPRSRPLPMSSRRVVSMATPASAMVILHILPFAASLLPLLCTFHFKYIRKTQEAEGLGAYARVSLAITSAGNVLYDAKGRRVAWISGGHVWADGGAFVSQLYGNGYLIRHKNTSSPSRSSRPS
jgi:hypothetical protein